MSSRLPANWRDHDYYAIIGVPVGATTEQITRAYHRLARTTHPDTGPDHSDAADRFRLLTDAHTVLTDPASRAAYDRARHPSAARASTAGSATPGPWAAATIPSSSHRPRPAGATVQPGPVTWTAAPKTDRREQR